MIVKVINDYHFRKIVSVSHFELVFELLRTIILECVSSNIPHFLGGYCYSKLLGGDT